MVSAVTAGERDLANADFRTRGSTQDSGELVAQGPVAPPGNDDLGGQVGLAEDR
jgi:hypothetical protein